MSYNNNNDYPQGGGYPHGNPQPYGQGEAASYYGGAEQQQQYPPQGQQGYGQPPQQNQQYQRDDFNDGPQQDGQDGERGFLGALGGGVAGAVGGNKIGGKMTGHSKTSTVIGALAGAVAGHKLQDGVSDWKDNRHEEKEKEKREEEERKRREEEEKRRREEQQHRPHHDNNNNNHHDQPGDRGVHYAGGFSGSSQDIRLDAHGEYMLHASCKRLDGSYQSSSISLNRLIENDQGSFRWTSGGRRNNGGSGQSSVTVQPGDTLRNIAARFDCSFEEIARHNGIANPDLIHPGTVLQIPNSGGGGGGYSSGGEGNFGASARDVRLTDGGRRLEGELLRDGRWVGSSIMLDEKVGNDNGTLTFVN
ncbi:autolysin [Parachaetomium inaequale]|uniref:Autolysin n=1 Tax=Parachaetomium inaequale TaxID=2588326 RepID=A0AAN6PG35_9PEZI|nr:autolysin [Parachaetomium inaequale]